MPIYATDYAKATSVKKATIGKLKMKKLVLISLFIIINFLCSNLSGFELIKIDGIILDKQTLEPLPYANIQVLNTNWGTTSNSDGWFSLALEKAQYKIKISYIGYSSEEIEVCITDTTFKIELKPTPIDFERINVYGDIAAKSWEEWFIKKVIEKKEDFQSKLKYFQAYAYAKTGVFMVDSTGSNPIGFYETISEMSFKKPDLYQEKILSKKTPILLNNINLEGTELNTDINVNLHHNNVKVHTFSIISPLNPKAFKYYSYKLTGKNLMGQDTVVTIHIEPKTNQIPLFMGDLSFYQDKYYLIEADLAGNDAVHDRLFGEIKLLQKYALKEQIFNLLVYSKILAAIELGNEKIGLFQEATIINYNINDPEYKPAILLDKTTIVQTNTKYDIDVQRDRIFNVPLTIKEKQINKTLDSLYVNAPILKKSYIFLMTNFLPLFADNPGNIGHIHINKLSNWYHFNKVSGHYLGGEYQFINPKNLNIYSNIGYSFGQKLWEYYFRTRYKPLTVEIRKKIVNLGGFSYNKIQSSMRVLFKHQDDFHYYLSNKLKATLSQNIGTRLNFSGYVQIEKQKSLFKTTEFSFFNRDKMFTQNVTITDNYWNNSVGFKIDYIENKDYLRNSLRVRKGDSFLNASMSYSTTNKSLLEASEDFSTFDIKIRKMQQIIGPVNVDLRFTTHIQSKTSALQNMQFINQYDPFNSQDNELSFFTLNNYTYFVENYFRLRSDITLFNLPKGMSIGLTGSYLHPLENGYESNNINKLDNGFWEYGIVLKGPYYINLYLLLDNVDTSPKFKILFYY